MYTISQNKTPTNILLNHLCMYYNCYQHPIMATNYEANKKYPITYNKIATIFTNNNYT